MVLAPGAIVLLIALFCRQIPFYAAIASWWTFDLLHTRLSAVGQMLHFVYKRD
jgi:hypothetical protein